MVNMSIQSRTATSSFSVFGEKLSSRRTFASYAGGSSTPDSASSTSAARKKSRVRSCRPRVAINTAELTSSGLATISSWAMNAPIDTATMRAGATSSFSISAAVSATMVSVRETVGLLGRADAAVVEGDAAIAGPQELWHLVQVPGAARAPATRDEQHRVACAAVVVGQIHADDATSRRFGRGPR